MKLITHTLFRDRNLNMPSYSVRQQTRVRLSVRTAMKLWNKMENVHNVDVFRVSIISLAYRLAPGMVFRFPNDRYWYFSSIYCSFSVEAPHTKLSTHKFLLLWRMKNKEILICIPLLSGYMTSNIPHILGLIGLSIKGKPDQSGPWRIMVYTIWHSPSAFKTYHQVGKWNVFSISQIWSIIWPVNILMYKYVVVTKSHSLCINIGWLLQYLVYFVSVFSCSSGLNFIHQLWRWVLWSLVFFW